MKFSNGIEIVEYNTTDTECIAVIGCLKTDKGMKILQELLSWVPNKFHTYIVYQDPPGNLYEYPAMKWAKDVAKLFNKSVMYIHTKGAVYDRIETVWVRNNWKDFYLNNYEWIMKNLDKQNTVCCLFTGKTKVPWFNSFIATPDAWEKTKIKISNDRYYFEQGIWKETDCNVIGLKANDRNVPEDMWTYMTPYFRGIK